MALTMSALGIDIIRNYAQPLMDVSATSRTIPAIEGQRIVDAITGKILEEPRHIFIAPDETIHYSDDGKTSGDLKAHDGVYSNIKPTNDTDYIGCASHHMLSLNLKMLRTIEEMSPLTFYGGVYATVDEYKELVAQKNKHLEGWTMRFLDPYRINKGDLESPFYSLYVPLPPPIPSIKAPPKFVAPTQDNHDEEDES